jgi:enamine deaminase RidA (YjgF/YER057c/UK114 family)
MGGINDGEQFWPTAGAVVCVRTHEIPTGASRSCEGVSVPREFLNPQDLSKPVGYTHAVASTGGRTIWISGQISTDTNGEVVGAGDLRAQTVQVFENLRVALTAAGAAFDDVVKMNIYVVNYKPEDRSIVREVRSRYLSAESPPASTLVGVTALAIEGLMIEIEVTAIVE